MVETVVRCLLLPNRVVVDRASRTERPPIISQTLQRRRIVNKRLIAVRAHIGITNGSNSGRRPREKPARDRRTDALGVHRLAGGQSATKRL
eukprot:4835399-Prymnesium_polylepis.2